MPRLALKRPAVGSWTEIKQGHIYSYGDKLYLKTDEGVVRLGITNDSGVYINIPTHGSNCEDLGPLEVVFE